MNVIEIFNKRFRIKSEFVVLNDPDFVVKFIVAFDEDHHFMELCFIEVAIFFHLKSCQSFLTEIFDHVNELGSENWRGVLVGISLNDACSGVLGQVPGSIEI